MSDWRPDEMPFDEATFCGEARLFPVPGLVLFPHVMQTLHIFEERYRDMTEDAVAKDGLIAIAQLEPGWETDYGGRPPLAPIACLGRIMTHHRFPDGRFNLLLLGVRRVRLVEEIQPPQTFRRAQVELLEETIPTDAEQRRIALLETLRRHLPSSVLASGQLHEVLSRDLPLPVLTDLLGFTLPLADDVKQRLLVEVDAAVRADTISRAVRDSASTGQDTSWSPPAFSEN